jgi:hypothetical protein
MAFLLLVRRLGVAGTLHTPAARRDSRSKKSSACACPYFGGSGGVKISRLRPGSGFGLGLGAFLVSRLPLSLFPMQPSMTQNRRSEQSDRAPQERRCADSVTQCDSCTQMMLNQCFIDFAASRLELVRATA